MGLFVLTVKLDFTWTLWTTSVKDVLATVWLVILLSVTDARSVTT
jgi:hypothetical protein